MKNKGNSAFDMTGFGKVFSFTLKETFKNKAYRTSFIAMVVMMTIMGPISYLGGRAGGKAAEDAYGSVKPEFATDEDKDAIKIYLVNETDITLDAENIEFDDEFMSQDMVKPVDKLPALTDTEYGFVITKEQSDEKDTYVVSGIISDESKISATELDNLAKTILSSFQIQMEEQEKDEEVIRFNSLRLQDGSITTELDMNGANDNKLPNEVVIAICTVYAIIIFMLVSLTASYIMASINEEKDSKLVETLLLSVKPMALVMGKIVAMLVYVMLMFAAGGLGASISNSLMLVMFPMEQTSEVASQVASNVSVSDTGIQVSGVELPINLGTVDVTTLVIGIIAIILNLFLTFFIFAMLAGIFGSACVKKEDLGSANTLLMSVALVGYIGSLVLANFTNPIIDTVISVVPFISSFVAPVYLLAGRIGFVTYFISFVLQVALVFALIWLCARVYKKMLLNDSEKFSLGLIFRNVGKEA